MTKLRFPALPMPDLNKLSNGLVAVAVIYGLYVMQKAYGAGDKLANQATRPIGQAWSDVSAWAGGYKAVELTPLVIQPWYLDDSYQISMDAWEILNRDADYQVLMAGLFDGRTLKAQYRHLIGQPITGL